MSWTGSGGDGNVPADAHREVRFSGAVERGNKEEVNMFAVVKTGGKQYRVAKDDVIRVEKLAAEPGEKVALKDVLLIDDNGSKTVGAPVIDGAAVEAEVVEQARDKKVLVFKKKRRQNYRRKKGHRQHLTVLKITDIVAKGAKAKKAKAAKAKAEDAPAPETAAETASSEE